MNLLEIAFWNVLFWALYLPIAVIILLLGAQGHPLGVVSCGFFGTAILSIFLGFQDDLLFESYTPVQVTITEAKPEPKESKSESKEPKGEKMGEPQVPEGQDEEVEVKSPEVEPVEIDAEVESDESEDVEFADGEEPEPRLRTDVVVEQLAVDDDDAFSVCD